MSGPKVVRVVTREELVAAGEALLSRLDAALGQWQRDCSSELSAADIQNTKERRDALVAMLRSDKFTEFARAAADEIGFLEADAQRRVERAAQVRAQERVRSAAGQQLAKTLLLTAISCPQPLREELEQVSAGRLSISEMDRVLSRASQVLFKPSVQSLTDGQAELAARLAEDVPTRSFEEWKARIAKPDVRLQSVFAHLSELEARGARAEAAALEQQLSHLQTLPQDANAQIRLDSLVLAVRKAKDAASAKRKVLREAALLAAELHGIAPSSATAARLQSADSAHSIDQVQSLLKEGQEELARARAAAAAAARRQAILSGLQKLGYQVQEGLSTATTEAGRLIVRGPADSGYGVEVVTGTGEKVQIRTVAFKASRSAGEDVQEERRWCGDFGKLQASLQADGCQIALEKALGVGATPVRFVELGANETRSSTSVASPSSRAR